MTLDLLGTCYTDQLRPPPLKPQHVAQWLSHSSFADLNGDAMNRPPAELTSAGMSLGSNQDLMVAGEASGLVLGASGMTAADATMQGESQAQVVDFVSISAWHAHAREEAAVRHCMQWSTAARDVCMFATVSR